jgi:hypothetical protein
MSEHHRLSCDWLSVKLLVNRCGRFVLPISSVASMTASYDHPKVALLVFTAACTTHAVPHLEAQFLIQNPIAFISCCSIPCWRVTTTRTIRWQEVVRQCLQ